MPTLRTLCQTSTVKKYRVLRVKNSFATIVNGLSVKKLFQLSNMVINFYFAACLKPREVRKPRIPKLGQGGQSLGKLYPMYPTKYPNRHFVFIFYITPPTLLKGPRRVGTWLDRFTTTGVIGIGVSSALPTVLTSRRYKPVSSSSS